MFSACITNAEDSIMVFGPNERSEQPEVSDKDKLVLYDRSNKVKN